MSGCCCPDRGGAGDFLTDEVCGNFSISCNDTDRTQTVWESVLNDTTTSPVSGGTVTVFFDRGCGDLTVNVYNDGGLVTSFTVPDEPQSSTGNTRAQTILAEFDTVEIVCGEAGDTGRFCTGKYCITAHYRLR